MTLKNCTVDELCGLFRSLLRQLPQSTTIFCLIDSVDCYETVEDLDDMSVVVLSLLELVEKPHQIGPSLKVLLTGPRPTIEVRKVFDDEPDTFLHADDLPMELDPMGSEGFQQQLGGDRWDSDE